MASNQQNTINKILNNQQEEEIHETESYRATAQQNSIDAIRSAEERYAKAKDSGATAFQHTKDAAVHGVCAGTDYITGKGYEAADFTAEKGSQGYVIAKDAAIAAAQKTVEVAKEVAVKAKDVTVGAGQSALNYATGKTGDVKDTSLGGKEETGEVKEKLGEQSGIEGGYVVIGEEEGRGRRKKVGEEEL